MWLLFCKKLGNTRGSKIASAVILVILLLTCSRGMCLQFQVQRAIIIGDFTITEDSVQETLDPSERIISDLSIIQSGRGVPLDFTYNETRIGLYSGIDGNSQISAPGCPKSIDGIPWIYYGTPPRCYLAGYRSPCDDTNAVPTTLLVDSTASNTGICACSCLKDVDLEYLEKSEDGRFIFCWFNYVYDQKANKCFALYDQGPCNDGYVLIKSSESPSVKCVQEDKGQCGYKYYNFETGKCDDVPSPPLGGGGGFGGSVGGILPNDCGSSEKYSNILKKCLKKRGSNGFSLIG